MKETHKHKCKPTHFCPVSSSAEKTAQPVGKLLLVNLSSTEYSEPGQEGVPFRGMGGGVDWLVGEKPLGEVD